MSLLRWFVAWSVLAAPCVGFAAPPAKPNVLFIILDDQNSFAGRRDLAPEAITPNLDRLAQRGVKFAHAQCAAPVCNPSRSALFSGLRPSASGVYDNDQGRLAPGHRFETTVSLPGYFAQHGYTKAGGGKIFASSLGSAMGKDFWDETNPIGARHKGDEARPPKEKLPLNGIGKHDWGAFPDNREQMEDWQLAGWAAEYLVKPHSQPFFLACGIVKPHTPWYVPQPYFDLFPPDRVTIADLADDETAGLPKIAREKWHRNDSTLVKRRKELVAAYLASSRYADDCVGRILYALENSPNRANTVVVICGDNGYQFGERNNWSKGKLWEGSTQVPLVMAGPEIAQGEVCTHAVSLLDIYPTLLELTRLPANLSLDGTSIVPLLKSPSTAWDRPVVTTARFQNHAVRSDRWRYIRYEDGSEELYDHEHDPMERNNLASQPESTAIKASLQKWLPKHNEPRAEPVGKGSDD